MSHAGPSTAAPPPADAGIKGMIGGGIVLLVIFFAIVFAYATRTPPPAAAAAATAASMVETFGPLTIPFALQTRTESVTGSSERKLSPLRPDVFENLSDREADSEICWTIMQRRSRFSSWASCGKTPPRM